MGRPVPGPRPQDEAQRVLAPAVLCHLPDRPGRHRAAEASGRGQRDVGLRLPASRRHLARQPGVPEHGADRHPTRDAAQDRPRQRDEALPAGQLTKPLRPERLIDFAAAVYQMAGLPPDDARLVADTLVQADLWGHQSHGVLRLGWYLDRVRNGVMKPTARPEFVIDGGAMALIDGNDGVGHVLAALATRQAIKRA